MAVSLDPVNGGDDNVLKCNIPSQWYRTILHLFKKFASQDFYPKQSRPLCALEFLTTSYLYCAVTYLFKVMSNPVLSNAKWEQHTFIPRED